MKPINTVVVEFLGLPGAGKTTLAESLSELLVSKGKVVATRKEINQWSVQVGIMRKLFLVLKQSLSIGYYFYHTFRFLTTLNPLGKGIGKRVLRTPLIDIYQNEFIKDRKYNWTLLDQGSLQNLWSMAAFSKSIEYKSLKTIFNVVMQGNSYQHVYVYLDSSPELVGTRVMKRSHGESRFDNMTSVSMTESLRNSNTVMCRLAELLSLSGKRVLILDAKSSIDENTKRIFDFIVAEDPSYRTES